MAGPMQVKQVNFRDGVYLSGVVRQSVGVASPEGSLFGVAAVDTAELVNHGTVVTMKGRRFLIPWASISSVELLPEDEVTTVVAVPPVETAKGVPAKR